MKKTISVLQWAAGAVFACGIIMTALITAFETAMYSDFSVYRNEYEKYDVLSELDMSMDDVMYVTEEMMAYLRGEREELSVITEVEGVQQDFFNEQDRFHMGEVRDLFLGGLKIRLVSMIAAFACFLFLFFSRAPVVRILCRTYQIVLGAAAVLSLALAAACAIDFNAVFVRFHYIFFDNDQWLFDPAVDYMIRMLPEGLFFDMVVRIGLIFFFFLAALLILSIVPDIKRKRKMHN